MNLIQKLLSPLRPSKKPTQQVEVQASFIEPTVLTGPRISTAVTNDNRGNQFITYARAAQESWKRYRNEAQYGNTLVREIVKYRSAWICGNGASVEVKGSAENKFLARFLELNKLEGSFLAQSGRSGELEGKCLWYLKPVKDGDDINIKLNYLRWEKYKYTVNVSEDDEYEITSVEFKDTKSKTVRLKPEEIVYVCLDKSADINKPVAMLHTILTNCINADKALADFRSSNHEYGIAQLHYECKDVASAQAMVKMLEAKDDRTSGGIQVGDIIAAPAKAYFIEPSGNGTRSLIEEITMQARIISGASGVMIHLLGWASEMSNRATAQDLSSESIAAMMGESRDIWEEGTTEAVVKAFEMYNQITGSNLKTDTIQARISQVSSHQIKELIDVWVPLADGGYISADSVRERIPDIDPRVEKKKLEEEKAGNIERQQELISAIRQESQAEEAEKQADDTDQKIRAINQ